MRRFCSWCGLFALLLILLTGTGCGGDDAVAPRCIDGETQACLCPGPSFGVQSCTADGRFGDCDCSGAAGEPDGGSSPTDSGSAGDDAGDQVDMPAPTVRNACGGTSSLAAAPGNPCGDPCNDGVLVCDGVDGIRCVGATAPNACGGCIALKSAPGDPCGPCGDGTLECQNEGTLACVGAGETNTCGGCADLDSAKLPGFSCVKNGEDGVFVCYTPDETVCIGPGDNACGGAATLTETPASPCGSCGNGRFQCASPNAIVCADPDVGLNACGGCGAPLIASPGTPCGACGGSWQCDGGEAVACDARLNLCGGCTGLADTIGEQGTCAQGEIAVCSGSNTTRCADEATSNPCGGTGPLADAPGEPCGTCGDGKFVCVGLEATACVEAELGANSCGGCQPLAHQPGEPCGPRGAAWRCDGTDDTICVLDPAGGVEPGKNLCGGTATLAGQPGTVCDECGLWACDPFNSDSVFCVGGAAPNTMEDPENCGTCGTVCNFGEFCQQGQCTFDKVIDVEADMRVGCLLLASGAVECWGRNLNGGVGDGTTTYRDVPTRVSGITDAVDLAIAGRNPTVCAALATGEVYCWGSSSSRALGQDNVPGKNPVPIPVPGISDVVEVVGYAASFCALRGSGTVVCWGENRDGHLGHGTTATNELPSDVVNLSMVVDIDIGNKHACAVRFDNSVWCWGDNANGQLGDGTSTDSLVPVEVVGLPASRRVVAGELFTCALTTNGEVLCWGYDLYGRLGNGPLSSGSTPLPVESTSTFDDLWAGTNTACALSSGEIYCWGSSRFGELGIGSLDQTVNTPSHASIPSRFGTSPAVAMGLGERLTWAVLDDGQVLVTGGSADFAPARGDGQLIPQSRDYRFKRLPTVSPVTAEDGLCRDGLDNDGDGATDCGDPDCASDLGSQTGTVYSGVLEVGDLNFWASTCLGVLTNNSEKVFTWVAPKSARYGIGYGQSQGDLTIEVRDGCGLVSVPLDCRNFDVSTSPTALVEFDAVAQQRYTIVVDIRFATAYGTAVQLTIDELPPP